MTETVMIEYTLELASGEIVESSQKGEALSYVLGSGEMIPALEQVIATMSVGEERRGILPAEAWIGPHDPGAMVEIPRDHLPPEACRVGAEITADGPNNARLEGRVAKLVDDDRVVVDFNHPLAGQPLHYTLKLVGRQ